MRFSKVRLAALGVTLPEEVITTAALEQRLSPLYERLRLPEGRLELMTGIRERRVWRQGTLPSEPSIETGRRVLEACAFDPQRIGCLVHASVCRDFLEPATASRVHAGLALPATCWTYDVSNACLGLLNGMVQIASLIEADVIEAGIVVGTEQSRALLEQTVQYLNDNTALTRHTIKPALASLTIGSASCAMLLAHERLCPEGAELLGAEARCHSQHHDLCRSDQDAGAGMQPLMDTDAERLLHAGLETGQATFEPFLKQMQWDRHDLDVTVCHQVGSRHRTAMLESLGLSPDRDHATFSFLGNTGSVALPSALASAAACGRIQAGQRIALLGIGSGINCVMAGLRWGQVATPGNWDSVCITPQ